MKRWDTPLRNTNRLQMGKAKSLLHFREHGDISHLAQEDNKWPSVQRG
jgi:hypothetical protein